jgi:MFS family permease
MFSIAVNFYPEQKDEIMGYIFTAEGLGCMLGPMIGTLLYMVGGYNFILYSFGTLFIAFSFVIMASFDESIDKFEAKS